MRKFKKNRTNNLNYKDIEKTVTNMPNKKEMKEIVFILIISWIFPFIGTFIMHFARKKLLERPKEILCKIVNMSFTIILIEFILTNSLQLLAYSGAPALVIYILMGVIMSIFIFGLVSHILGTIKWAKGEDFSYKFSVNFFKSYE